MTSSYSREWHDIRSLEDLMALLRDIDEQRVIVKRLAWQQGEIEMYEASEKQRAAIEKFKKLLSQKWHILVEEIGDTDET